MDTNWATEHLQVIRTLMERSAVYRRALAPVMILNGVLGGVAAIVGLTIEIDSPRSFIIYWFIVAVLALAGSFLLVRKQALKADEPFWSPPTRRVTQAMLPGLVAGGIITAVAYFELTRLGPMNSRIAGVSADYVTCMVWLPAGWIILYGCAFHAAGFFMPRGMKIFGWAFILGGCAVLALGVPEPMHRLQHSQAIMGFFFGLLHLAYGIYLYFTEKSRNET